MTPDKEAALKSLEERISQTNARITAWEQLEATSEIMYIATDGLIGLKQTPSGPLPEEISLGNVSEFYLSIEEAEALCQTRASYTPIEVSAFFQRRVRFLKALILTIEAGKPLLR